MRANKVSRRAALVGLASTVAAPAPAHRRGLLIGVPNAYPFSRMNGAVAEGIIADPMQYAFQRAGVRATFIQLQLDNIYRSVEDGSLDGGFVMTPIGDRGRRAVYLRPVVHEYSVLLTRREAVLNIQTIDDLWALRLGGRIGFVYSALPDQMAAGITRSPTDADTIRALLLGRIDVAIIGGIKVIHELRAEGVMLYLKPTGRAVGRVGLGAALSHSAAGRVDIPRLNRAIGDYVASTRWPVLLEQHASSTLVVTPKLL